MQATYRHGVSINDELEKTEKVYKDKKELKYYKYLWYDKENNIVYFMSGLM